jgi:hypothetical protein
MGGVFMGNIELIESKKGLLKKVIIPAVAIILFSTGYGLGSSGAKTEINGEKVKYEEVTKEIKSAKEDLKTYQAKVVEIQTKIKSVQTEYAENKTEFDTAKKIADQKATITGQLASVESDLEAKKKESSTLDGEIKSKKKELAKVESAIIEKDEAPVKLPAGQFLVGKDIPEGRYKVLAIGRGSNFKVYDSDGSNVVNTIIYSGNPDFGVSEYVTVLSEGYIIDASSAFKYVPVD